MTWQKRGLVALPPVDEAWSRSHAMVPTPFVTASGDLRLYYSACDSDGCARPAWVDFDVATLRAVGPVHGPLLDFGRPGCFDDNGVLATSVVDAPDGRTFMYYVGFEQCRKIRYRLFTGLAISEDGGQSFRRHADVPILDRSHRETFFRGGPCVRYEGGRFRMWYVGGGEWIELFGKPMPVYSVCYAESDDGITWPAHGEVVLAPTSDDEHGFGRPWVERDGDGYVIYLSVRRRSLGAYRLGMARSPDGRTWTRCDEELGLDVSPAGFDAQAIMYLATVEHGGRRLGFYNGDDFGRAGFAVVERVNR